MVGLLPCDWCTGNGQLTATHISKLWLAELSVRPLQSKQCYIRSTYRYQIRPVVFLCECRRSKQTFIQANHFYSLVFILLMNVAEWFGDTVICQLVCCSLTQVMTLTIRVKNELAVMCGFVSGVHWSSSLFLAKQLVLRNDVWGAAAWLEYPRRIQWHWHKGRREDGQRT